MLQDMANPKVFVILVNWNNWDETRECLESLAAVIYSDYEVIIVDNGSNERPPVAKRGRVELLCNDSNLGFAGGNNVGIKYALDHGADYVMLLNNDTVVAPDFLTELVRTSEKNFSSGILGSQIYKYGTDEVVFDGGKINIWLNKAEHTGNAESLPPSSIPPLRKGGVGGGGGVDYITGAAMLMKREVIEKIGLMREEFFLYYEDVDWCLRARRAGYKCVLVPTSKVWHKVSATTKEGSPSYIYYHTRNALMLAKFNGNLFQKIAAYFLGAWILLKQIPKFLFMPRRRIWARSIVKGILDFYRGKYGKYENRN
jgi:hypothetical protein